MLRFPFRQTFGFAGALVCLAPAGAFAQDTNFENLAKELAELRTEVESLSGQIDQVREDTRLRIRNLASQKTSLEAEIQREQLRVRELNQALEQVKARIREAGALQRELKPQVLASIDQVIQPVKQGLPFRISERIASLEKLKKEVEDDVVAPATAVQRLWTAVEDEIRLGRENGMYQQTIEVEGEEILADVARIGMVMLYFRTPDERFGQAVRSGDDWVFKTYADPAKTEALKELYTKLEARVRVGFFELPNALPSGGTR